MLKQRLLELAGVEEKLNIDTIKSAILDTFKGRKHNPPSLDDLINLSKELDITPKQVQDIMLELFTAFAQTIGRHNHVPDNQFNQTELERGIRVEMEHTNDLFLAKLMAKDRLMEIPNYYSRLNVGNSDE